MVQVTEAPEAASLALREFLTGPEDEKPFADFLAWLQRERVLPQIILYEPAETIRLAELQRRGLIPWRDLPVLFVLGATPSARPRIPRAFRHFLLPT
ncbi:conserved hypothetical protein [Mesorhizobium delmotii]|uniref:Uncharacterized protein n=1 Tax=Mesorhizobium delmotii TaxID=1631247 RepID=A0A2P9AUF8_9HYPH|nr:conserved hypothetical protein [Mesorhizobium delmotii]